MRDRNWRILEILVRNNNANLDYLAKELKVSQRTLRNDINEINNFFNELNHANVIKLENGKIYLKDKIDKKFIEAYIQNFDYYFYRMSKIERQHIITLILLKEKKYITMNDLAEKLYVTRVTIINDMQSLEKQLAEYNIDIKSKASKGVYFIYQEEDARMLLVDLLLHYFKNDNANVIMQRSIMNELLTKYPIKDIINILKQVEKELQIYISDDAFRRISFYLFVVLNRVIIDKTVYNVATTQYGEQEVAKKIASLVQENLEISLDSNETNTLANYLAKEGIFPKTYDVNDYSEMYTIVADFLYRISATLNLQIFEDYSLFELLVLHLQASADRINNGKEIKNPFYDEIAAYYGQILDAVKEHIVIVEEYCNCTFNKDELSFIAMHISAAIERLDMISSYFDIVIVCPNSVATGQLLSAQIEKYFNFNIKNVIQADHLIESLNRDIDFIISSVPIEQTSIPVLVVHPILQPDDINNIVTFIFKLYQKFGRDKKKKTYKKNNLIKKISKIINDESNHGESIQLENELWSIIKNYEPEEEVKNTQPYLYEILRPETIEFVDMKIQWKDALLQANLNLVENHFTTVEYGEALVNITEKYGPYFVFRKGVALAHAGNKDGVISLGMTLLVLKKGVSFGHKDNDPVKLLFCLSNEGSYNYLRVANTIIEIGKDMELVEKIINSTNSLEVYNLIQEKEKGMQ